MEEEKKAPATINLFLQYHFAGFDVAAQCSHRADGAETNPLRKLLMINFFRIWTAARLQKCK